MPSAQERVWLRIATSVRGTVVECAVEVATRSSMASVAVAAMARVMATALRERVTACVRANAARTPTEVAVEPARESVQGLAYPIPRNGNVVASATARVVNH